MLDDKVISPDPNVGVNEVVIPKHVAKRLTFPEVTLSVRPLEDKSKKCRVFCLRCTYDSWLSRRLFHNPAAAFCCERGEVTSMKRRHEAKGEEISVTCIWIRV